MKKKKTKSKKNLVLAVFFCISVLVVIIIASIIRIVILTVQSTFDYQHQFILDLKSDKIKEDIIIFNPDTKSIIILTLQNNKKLDVPYALSIPVSAYATVPAGYINENIREITWNLFIHNHKVIFKKMNSIDALKLYFFAHSITVDNITVKYISLNADINSQIAQLLIDTTLYHEGFTISIINASGVPGLGNMLAKLITNIGGNVISVTSTDLQQQSHLQTNVDVKTYTIKKLEDIFNVSVQKMQKQTLSDIIITIGEKHSPL